MRGSEGKKRGRGKGGNEGKWRETEENIEEKETGENIEMILQ